MMLELSCWNKVLTNPQYETLLIRSNQDSVAFDSKSFALICNHESKVECQLQYDSDENLKGVTIRQLVGNLNFNGYNSVFQDITIDKDGIYCKTHSENDKPDEKPVKMLFKLIEGTDKKPFEVEMNDIVKLPNGVQGSLQINGEKISFVMESKKTKLINDLEVIENPESLKIPEEKIDNFYQYYTLKENIKVHFRKRKNLIDKYELNAANDKLRESTTSVFE
eukprot:NODE_468_length_7060_cov_0.310157.p4 type:complete len:222 gc:universal NODE_468_length_7060_cov_0.310157:1826-1161(-)